MNENIKKANEHLTRAWQECQALISDRKSSSLQRQAALSMIVSIKAILKESDNPNL